MQSSNKANSEAWKKGVLAGYSSVKPHRIPSIPAMPATVPAYIKNTTEYYYKLGHERGTKMAHQS